MRGRKREGERERERRLIKRVRNIRYNVDKIIDWDGI